MTGYFACYLPSRRLRPVRRNRAMSREIDALNDELVVAGTREFVGSLSPARARSPQPNGSARYRRAVHETKEHIGGFWVLEAADLNEALASGRKAAVASRASVEVRPIN